MTQFARNAAIFAIAAFSLLSQTASAQKIAIVDLNAVATALPDYQAAQKKIQDLSAAYQDSLKMMQTKYQTTVDTYNKLGDAASADTKKKEQDDLAGLQQQYSKFQEDKFGQQGELAQMQQNLLKPIQDRLQNVLDKFGAKEHYTAIFPKSATIFVDQASDVTSKFQDYLKTQAQ